MHQRGELERAAAPYRNQMWRVAPCAGGARRRRLVLSLEKGGDGWEWRLSEVGRSTLHFGET
jgi:hypothetical protein